LSKKLSVNFIDFLFTPIYYCDKHSIRFNDLIAKQLKLGIEVLSRMNIQFSIETNVIISSLKSQSKSHLHQKLILKDFETRLINFQILEIDVEEEENEPKCIIYGLSKNEKVFSYQAFMYETRLPFYLDPLDFHHRIYIPYIYQNFVHVKCSLKNERKFCPLCRSYRDHSIPIHPSNKLINHSKIHYIWLIKR
jgi:hypothetical protein